MALKKDSCISNLKKMLHLLVNNGKVREQDCDVIANEEIPKCVSEKFKEFDKTKSSVDELWMYGPGDEEIQRIVGTCKIASYIVTLTGCSLEGF